MWNKCGMWNVEWQPMDHSFSCLIQHNCYEWNFLAILFGTACHSAFFQPQHISSQFFHFCYIISTYVSFAVFLCVYFGWWKGLMQCNAALHWTASCALIHHETASTRAMKVPESSDSSTNRVLWGITAVFSYPAQTAIPRVIFAFHRGVGKNAII